MRYQPLSLFAVIAAIGSIGLFTFTSSAGVIPIDLTTWSQAGPPGNGNWVVSPGGASVLQTTNGNPTFFVSPNEFFNTNVVGKFGVETTSDDDFIGFVFGFQSADNGTVGSTNDFLLFDWKQTSQSFLGAAEEGFALSRVNGSNAAVGNSSWNHDDDNTAFDVLATNQSSTLGWVDNQVYDFDLLYTNDRIRIAVAPEGGVLATIFDITGTFQSGKFGFYNYSQSAVRYQSFTQSAVQPPGGSVPEPGTLLAFAGIVATTLGARKNKFFV